MNKERKYIAKLMFEAAVVKKLLSTKELKKRVDSNATCSKQKFKQVCQRNLRLYAYKLYTKHGKSKFNSFNRWEAFKGGYYFNNFTNVYKANMPISVTLYRPCL